MKASCGLHVLANYPPLEAEAHQSPWAVSERTLQQCLPSIKTMNRIDESAKVRAGDAVSGHVLGILSNDLAHVRFLNRTSPEKWRSPEVVSWNKRRPIVKPDIWHQKDRCWGGVRNFIFTKPDSHAQWLLSSATTWSVSGRSTKQFRFLQRPVIFHHQGQCGILDIRGMGNMIMCRNVLHGFTCGLKQKFGGPVFCFGDGDRRRAHVTVWLA
jgi:hypothetical protein